MDLIEDGWERLTPAEQRLLAAFREWPETKRSILLDEVGEQAPTPVAADMVAGV